MLGCRTGPKFVAYCWTLQEKNPAWSYFTWPLSDKVTKRDSQTVHEKLLLKPVQLCHSWLIGDLSEATYRWGTKCLPNDCSTAYHTKVALYHKQNQNGTVSINKDHLHPVLLNILGHLTYPQTHRYTGRILG